MNEDEAFVALMEQLYWEGDFALDEYADELQDEQLKRDDLELWEMHHGIHRG